MKLKFKVLIVLLYLLKTVVVFGQAITDLHRPVFNGIKNIDISKDNPNVQDCILDNNNVIFLRLAEDSFTVEYFRISDSSFHSRKTYESIIIEEGVFTMNLGDQVSIDTIVYFDPITLEDEQIDIIVNHSLYKNGNWNELSTNGDRCSGKYLNGKREGFWRCSNQEEVHSFNYSNGKIVGIYSPTDELIKENISWFLNKEFVVCKETKYSFMKANSPYLTIKYLFAKPKEECSENGEFKFFTDGKFHFVIDAHESQSKKSNKKSGTWEIIKLNNGAELILTFPDSLPEKFLIKYLGKDAMVWEIENSK
ncbi:MAG: hypothetical protein R2879_01710 [Saprospiraceae bacterium]